MYPFFLRLPQRQGVFRLPIWNNEPHSFNCFIYLWLISFPALAGQNTCLNELSKKDSSRVFFSLLSLRNNRLFQFSIKKKMILKKNWIWLKLRQYKLHLSNKCSENSPMNSLPTTSIWSVISIYTCSFINLGFIDIILY